MMDTTTNMNKIYSEYDEFICEKCGLHLEDWKKLEPNQYGDIDCFEYALKYCPNCGRRIIQ